VPNVPRGRRKRGTRYAFPIRGRGHKEAVDWYLDGDDAYATSLLRHEISSYLRRHGEATSEFADAELVIAEVLGNAVRHAGGPVWVSLSWQETSPTLAVRDLGPGFDATQLERAVAEWSGEGDVESEVVGGMGEGGRGLFLITRLAPEVEARVRAEQGMSVTVTLPVRRAPVVSHEPLRRGSGALPSLGEARPEGAFGKESFLRALVVQLAQSVEFLHGPDAAEAAVAQVGTDVGGQMEAEFRRAAQVVGRMSPEQLGRCYVRLKHAIDGGFSVVEADEERIVLANDRCPFGDVVKLAPSLCRMTSSVFGGIAARNSDDGAAVLLEERIAVGDPGCRVVVYLGEPPTQVRAHAHRYHRPQE
jgi:anti-sigma regulatory factor (Ser/Thr protein kinase)